MSFQDYNEVRKLLTEKKLEEANIISNKVKQITKKSTEKQFWHSLIEGEIKNYLKEYSSAKSLFENTIKLSNEISISDTLLGRIHGKYAIILYRMNNYSDAIFHFRQALSLVKDELQRRHYYFSSLLGCFFKLNNKEQFFHTFREAIHENFQNLTDQNFHLFIDLAWNFTVYLAKEEWYSTAAEILTTLDEYISENSLKKCYFEFICARIARIQVKYETFILHMQNCLKLSKEVNLNHNFSLILNFVSMLENPFGDYQRAASLLLDILSNFPESSGTKLYILNKLGSTLRFLGDYQKSIRYLEEAININLGFIKDIGQEAYSHNTLGMVYTLIGNNLKAKEHYQKSLLLNKQINDKYGLGFTYGAIAWLECNQGNLDEAKKLYKDAIDTFKSFTDPPSIILLSYAELLSRIGNGNIYEINDLIRHAKEQIWINKKLLDMGRYYNALGNIALNQNKHEIALEEFSSALEYSGESFEVEVQTLLGITKTNLELFIRKDDIDYLNKAELFLNDLKTISRSSNLILGEVDLILGIIDMYKQDLFNASRKFLRVHNHAQKYNFSILEEKVQRQMDILNIMKTHGKIQKLVNETEITQKVETHSIRKAIDYLNELTKILKTHQEVSDDRSNK